MFIQALFSKLSSFALQGNVLWSSGRCVPIDAVVARRPPKLLVRERLDRSLPVGSYYTIPFFRVAQLDGSRILNFMVLGS